MIVNTYSNKAKQARYGVHSTSGSSASYGITNGVSLELLYACCQNLQQTVLINQTTVKSVLNSVRAIKKCCDENSQGIRNLYSAIRDIRKEQLRGRRSLEK